MITVFGEGRRFRVVWLLEEMGLPYRLRRVDLVAGVENDPEYLEINPAGFIPAIRDGDVTMVESIAIMEYLMARHGPTLVPDPHDPAFAAYQQFLHLGEAGLAASMYFVVVSLNRARGQKQNWGADKAMEVFQSRQLGHAATRPRTLWPAEFTAADISVTYALEFAQRGGRLRLGEVEQDYIARTTGREAYLQRAMETCHDTRAWVRPDRRAASLVARSPPDAAPAGVSRDPAHRRGAGAAAQPPSLTLRAGRRSPGAAPR